MGKKQTVLWFLSLSLVVSCSFMENSEKEEVLPELTDGSGGSYFEDNGEITSSGTNFPAPWSPGDFWNYGGGWCSNVNNYKDRQSAHFYTKKDHNCIDINYINKGDSDKGMPFFAVFDGCVVENKLNGGYGNLLIIQSSEDKNIQFKMGHHDELSFLSVGECIKKGQIISYCGTTGNSDYAHGHYCIEEKQNGVYSSIPFNKIGEHNYREDLCLQGNVIEVKSTNDFEFQRIETEFSTNFLGSIENQIIGYRGIHWYYDFVVNGSTSFSSTNQNNVLIQDWFNSAENRRSAIVYDVLHGARRGYVVHSGFAIDGNKGWLQDSNGVNTSGPRSKLGVPISNEYIENGTTYQNFMFGYLTWKNGVGVSYHEYPVDNYTIGDVSQTLYGDATTLTMQIKVVDQTYPVHWSKKFSYLFVDAYNKSQKDGHWLGFPIESNLTNEASVDSILSSPNNYKYFIQEFYNSNESFLQNFTIIYDPDNKVSLITNGTETWGGENKAYVIRSGFWNLYKQIYINGQDALDYCGAPVMDESLEVPYWVEYYAGDVSSYQIFERCFMTWGQTQNINVYLFDNGNFNCHNFKDNPNLPGNYVTSYCSIEPCVEDDGQGGVNPNNYCDDYQQLNCWDQDTCGGNGYWSPQLWHPNLPESFPPKCNSNSGLSTKYPTSWECCCGFSDDWSNGGNRVCTSGTWGEYGDVELVGTAPEPELPTPSCPQVCPQDMQFQCWDISCTNYGNGYGSPPLWDSACYTDTPPYCGNWSGGSNKFPTVWQCCCGYDNEWIDGGNNTCRSSVYNVF